MKSYKSIRLPDLRGRERRTVFAVSELSVCFLKDWKIIIFISAFLFLFSTGSWFLLLLYIVFCACVCVSVCMGFCLIQIKIDLSLIHI